MQIKTSSAELKVADSGEVEAVFATLNVKDHDDDWTLPGAFEEGAKVAISSYGHRSWQGEPPVGRGTIHEEAGRAILKGRFFLTTAAGREAFEIVKEMGDIGEWSFGYDALEVAPVTPELREKGVRRVLKKLKVFEVSPVLRGAGIGTGTLSVKCDGCQARGTSCGCATKHTDTREAAVREKARFEKTRFAMVSATISSETPTARNILAGREVKAFRVPAQLRTAAEEAAALVTTLLSPDDEPPRVRWFGKDAALRAGCDGLFVKGDKDIWVVTGESPEYTYEITAHETFHRFRPDAKEEDVARFGRILQTLRGSGRKLYAGGPRKSVNINYFDDGDLIVTDDLAVLQRNGGELEEVAILA